MTIATWLQVVDVSFKSFSMLQSDSCDWQHCHTADGSNAGALLYETLEIMETITYQVLDYPSGAGIYMYCRGELYAIGNRRYLYPAHLPTLLSGGSNHALITPQN